MTLDPRVTLASDDLADAALQGVVRAGRFAIPTASRVVVPATGLRRAPGPDAEQIDQLLFGERFDWLAEAGAFSWGQARRDGYVGFVETAALGDLGPAPTHWVRALRTFAFAEASIKAPARGPLSLNALVRVTDQQEPLACADAIGWIPRAHLAPIGAGLDDIASVAELYLGTPYLWGGRDSLGLDCSGLVQQALYACAQACPRDTDQQAGLGYAVPPDGLVRGDLVFWRGHVGMMLDGERLIHANAHHMAVAVEPLAEARGRIAAKGGGEPTTFRRLPRRCDALDLTASARALCGAEDPLRSPS